MKSYESRETRYCEAEPIFMNDRVMEMSIETFDKYLRDYDVNELSERLVGELICGSYEIN